MKKLLSILLCAAILASLTPSVFAAANGCLNTMSDKTWTFSENSDVEGFYGVLGNVAGNDNGTSTISVMADKGLNGAGDHALVLNRVKDSNNINMSFAHHTGTGTITPSEFAVKFNFKTSATGTLFRYAFRKPNVQSNADYNALQIANGNIDFLGVRVKDAAYSVNVWYDIEMLFNIPKGFGELKFRKNGDSAWNTYRVIANNGLLKDLTCTNRLAIGVQANAGEVCLDNYYQNNADVPAAFLGSDDFMNGWSGWKYDNLNSGVSANTESLSAAKDGVVLAIRGTDTTTQKNAHVNKPIDSTVIANAAVDTNYHFKFKMGGDASKGSFGATLQTASGTAQYKDLFIVKKVGNRLAFWGELGSDTQCNWITESFGAWDTSALYDVEAVYNPSSGKITAVITNADGKQLIASNSSGLLSDLPTRIAFRNCAAPADSSVAYYDDFETDILDSNGPAFLSSEVLSGFASKAALDETAVFTYDRTINQPALADAVVTLNGTTLDKADYTITSKGAQVLVSVKGLEKGKPYTVGLSGVKDILGNASAAENEATVTFTTSDVDITATKPVLNGTVLSTTVTSYYANGKTIKFILAIYNDAETMIEAVKVIDVTVSDRNGKVEEADFSEILANAAGKKVKGFVWDSFGTMEPYALSYEGTYNN